MYHFQTDGIVNYMKKQAGPDSVNFVKVPVHCGINCAMGSELV